MTKEYYYLFFFVCMLRKEKKNVCTIQETTGSCSLCLYADISPGISLMFSKEQNRKTLATRRISV